MDLVQYLAKQIDWSERTFGPGDRHKGVIDHIRKELGEIEEVNGTDLEEWIDVVILGLDGAWRAGFTPQQVADKLAWKLKKNTERTWPDWRQSDGTTAIEHVRHDVHAQALGQPCDWQNKACGFSHCPFCHKHLCPVCGNHYFVMAFEGNTQGCCTTCIKESTGDTLPWQGMVKEYKLGNER